jgi:Zn finger protein HypA/HybF involved in hydrogenase expression
MRKRNNKKAVVIIKKRYTVYCRECKQRLESNEFIYKCVKCDSDRLTVSDMQKLKTFIGGTDGK